MRHLFLLILLLGPSSTVRAEPTSLLLGGTYRVQGECAYQTDDGEYKSCVAWNTLTLQQLPTPGDYSFDLATSTFATTPGGCQVDGRMRLTTANGVTKLVRADDDAECRLSFQVTPHNLVLEVPNADARGDCRSACGMTSSLYSEPFPRSSRRLK